MEEFKASDVEDTKLLKIAWLCVLIDQWMVISRRMQVEVEVGI